MVMYKNEQPRKAILCIGWTRLETGFNLTCRRRVLLMPSYRFNVHMTVLFIGGANIDEFRNSQSFEFASTKS